MDFPPIDLETPRPESACAPSGATQAPGIPPHAIFYGALASLIALGVLEALRGSRLEISAPTAVYLLAIVYASSVGGIAGGALSAGLLFLHALLFFSDPGALLVFDAPDRIRLLILAMAAPGTVLMIGLVKRRELHLLHLQAQEQTRRQSEAIARARIQARDSESRYRLLFDNNPMPMYVFDLESLAFLAANAAATGCLGYSQHELMSMTIKDIRPPEEVPRLMAKLAGVPDKLDKAGVWKYRRKDGSLLDVEITTHPIEFADRPARLVLVTDVTAQHQAQQELRLAHEKLRGYADQLEKRVAERTRELEETNAEMQAFSYSVSHDLRAPLRAMQGFSQALLEDFGPGLGEGGQDYARRIASSAAHMDLLIQDLLAYSRLSRTEILLVPVGLQEAADEALQQVQSAVREHGASVDVRRPLPLVRAHRGTLVQILANLLGNAVKFHPAGATPSVSLWAEPRDRVVRVWVEDNGIGVPPEHRERIFRAFERLHGAEQYQGTGIGLAIVRKGAERMGGRAGVEARAGGGSRFWIELRAREEA